MDFAVPYMPDKVESGGGGYSFDNIHIHFKGSYKPLTRWRENMQMWEMQICRNEFVYLKHTSS